jgi:hypothetical protein
MTDQASPPISRRTLIAGAAAAALATGARAAPPLRTVLRTLPAGGPTLSPSLVSLTAAAYGDWSRMVGAGFTLMAQGRNLGVTLSQVISLAVTGKRPTSLRGQPFSIRFTGPVLPAGNTSYTIVHPSYGALTLFFDAATPAGLTAQFN